MGPLVLWFHCSSLKLKELETQVGWINHGHPRWKLTSFEYEIQACLSLSSTYGLSLNQVKDIRSPLRITISKGKNFGSLRPLAMQVNYYQIGRHSVGGQNSCGPYEIKVTHRKWSCGLVQLNQPAPKQVHFSTTELVRDQSSLLKNGKIRQMNI